MATATKRKARKPVKAPRKPSNATIEPLKPFRVIQVDGPLLENGVFLPNNHLFTSQGIADFATLDEAVTFHNGYETCRQMNASPSEKAVVVHVDQEGRVITVMGILEE